jgi:signal transduction histidine kinase
MHQLQTTTDHERIGRRSDGSLFPIYFAISRVTIGNRRIFTGVIQDITDRKQVEGERLEKERLSIELQKEREMREIKNRFISMMSHELRTPLASIMLSNDMLKRYGEQAPPEEKLLYFNNISTQVALLTDLIRDVSTISRSDTQSQTLMPERANIVEYCRDIVDEFRLTYEESHALIFSSPATEIYATIDTKVMRQVLSNLVSNAIKYTPEGGEIIVYVSNGGRYAKVRVSDNGIGIPQDDQKYLFQPFHRASNVDTLPGTGLGLSIAKQAVELHNGTISIESQVGVGTSITVNLPIDLSGEY